MSYDILIYTPFDNTHVRTISDAISFECARSLNAVGRCQFEIPLRYEEFPFWMQDFILRIYNRSYRRSNLVGNTIWFVDKIDFDYVRKIVTVSGHDTIGLLKRYIVAYTKGTDYAEKTFEYGLHDYGSNLMKQFLRENIGSLALDGTRNLEPYVFITDDDDLGAVCEKEASFQTLESVCTDIANQSKELGTVLYFDLIPDDHNRMTFQVYKDTLGVDRRVEPRQIIFSPERNNLVDPMLIKDFSESVNTVYIGGDGEDAGRLILTVQNPTQIIKSPYARRERFFDAKDTSSVETLTAKAWEYVQKFQRSYAVAGKAINTPGQQFGIDYGFGDQVVIVIGKRGGFGVIDAFAIKSEGGEDSIEISIKGEVEF